MTAEPYNYDTYFKDRVEVAFVYVREAHPGENYPRHLSAEQKMRQARAWVQLDKVPWTVAVDMLEGATHEAYGMQKLMSKLQPVFNPSNSE